MAARAMLSSPASTAPLGQRMNELGDLLQVAARFLYGVEVRAVSGEANQSGRFQIACRCGRGCCRSRRAAAPTPRWRGSAGTVPPASVCCSRDSLSEIADAADGRDSPARSTASRVALWVHPATTGTRPAATRTTRRRSPGAIPHGSASGSLQWSRRPPGNGCRWRSATPPTGEGSSSRLPSLRKGVTSAVPQPRNSITGKWSHTGTLTAGRRCA